MLKEGTIPIVDQPLIQAVKYALDQLGINPDTLPKKKRRTCLDGVGNGGESSYNGYFTIKLRTLEDGTQKIVVCDGATYDAEKGTSGESLCQVNGSNYYIPYAEFNFDDVVGRRLFIVYRKNEDTHKYEAVLQWIGNTESIHDTNYIVGEVYSTSLVQRHGATGNGNGVPQLTHIVTCEEALRG